MQLVIAFLGWISDVEWGEGDFCAVVGSGEGGFRDVVGVMVGAG